MNPSKQKNLYNGQPCERCGSKKITSKTWNETITTSLGKLLTIEVSETTCTNKECQAVFDIARKKETQIINERKIFKENQIKEKKEIMAKNAAERLKKLSFEK